MTTLEWIIWIGIDDDRRWAWRVLRILYCYALIYNYEAREMLNIATLYSQRCQGMANKSTWIGKRLSPERTKSNLEALRPPVPPEHQPP